MDERKCSMRGCDNPPDPKAGRGMCSPCYQRLRARHRRARHRRAGTPLPPSPTVLAKVQRDTPDPVTPGVDERTEALTERGWLRYDEIGVADNVYALDMASMTARFEPVTDVSIHPARTRKARLIEVGGYSALSTLSQRWPVRTRRMVKRQYVTETTWRTTEFIGAKVGFCRTLPNANVPTEAKYSDAFVELVAWFWNEGNYEWRGNTVRAGISQSWDVNAHKFAAIQRAMEAAFPRQYKIRQREDGYGYFRIYRDACDRFLEVTEHDKAPTLSFVLSLTQSQLGLFIDTCMAGDGHTTMSGVRRWSQCSMFSVRRFEMICALAGVPTNTRFKAGERYESHLGRDGYNVGLLRRNTVNPIDSIAELTSGRRKGGRVEATDAHVRHEGLVWSLTTPSNTWLARRNGSVYFTGSPAT